MTAKEMFNNLGFKHRINTNNIEYYKHIYDDHGTYKIIFIDNSFQISYLAEGFMEGPSPVDMPTFSAIYQQVKELGWLEDN